ncbi:TRNA-intron lyase [Aphelenchoides bicaudatus]|nr:TRNA-intron lyase [Aphelenchoides bicaudatus]
MDENPIKLVYYDENEARGHEQIFVDLVGENFLLFKSEYVDLLWDKYRIVADSIDEELNDYGSKHLPAILLPEQVQILMECGFVSVRRVAKLDVFLNPVEVKPVDVLSEEEKEKLRDRATRIVCGQLIKERKRKANNDDVPAKKRKVTPKEIEAELQTTSIDVEAVENAFEELVSKRSVKSENFVTLEHEAPSNFYEHLGLEQIPFPTTNEYRLRLAVFRDLWRKGFFLTSGIKFGCHFLAYEASPTRVHSKYMVFCRSPADSMMPAELTALSRVGSQVKKKVLVSIISCVCETCCSSLSLNRSLAENINGTLHSVDQYLNVKLVDITVQDTDKHPHMMSVKNCFIRGSVVRYIHLPAESEGIDTQLLQEATRKEILRNRQTKS